jgi:hypothetical protein
MAVWEERALNEFMGQHCVGSQVVIHKETVHGYRDSSGGGASARSDVIELDAPIDDRLLFIGPEF